MKRPRLLSLTRLLPLMLLGACQTAPTALPTPPAPSADIAPSPAQTETPSEPSAEPSSDRCQTLPPVAGAEATAVAAQYRGYDQSLLNLLAQGQAPFADDRVASQDETLLNGLVFDASGRRVETAHVSLRSLNPTRPYQAETELQGGRYIFTAAPAGVQLELRVEKPGYTTRLLQIVLRENPYRNPELNRYDIGYGNPDAEYVDNGLNPKPEVIAAWFLRPHLNANVMGLGLRFSEPVDRSSARDSLALYYAPQAGETEPNDVFLDRSNFDYTWMDGDREVEVHFKDDYDTGLPAQELENTFWSFTKGPGYLEDLDGERRDKDFFKLDGSRYDSYLSYAMIGQTELARNSEPEPLILPTDLEREPVEAIPTAPPPGPLPPAVEGRRNWHFDAPAASEPAPDTDAQSALAQALPAGRWPPTPPDFTALLAASKLRLSQTQALGEFHLGLALYKLRAPDNEQRDDYLLGLSLSPALTCTAARAGQTAVTPKLVSLDFEAPAWLRDQGTISLKAPVPQIQPLVFWPLQANQGDYQGSDLLKIDLTYLSASTGQEQHVHLERKLSDLLAQSSVEDIGVLKAAWQIGLSQAFLQQGISASVLQRITQTLEF